MNEITIHLCPHKLRQTSDKADDYQSILSEVCFCIVTENHLLSVKNNSIYFFVFHILYLIAVSFNSIIYIIKEY